MVTFPIIETKLQPFTSSHLIATCISVSILQCLFCLKIFLVHHLRLNVHKVQRSRIHWAHQIHSKELCYKGSNNGDLLQWLQCFWGLALSNCNQLLVECHKIFQFLLEDGILYIKDCREDPGSCLVGLQKNSTNQNKRLSKLFCYTHLMKQNSFTWFLL